MSAAPETAEKNNLFGEIPCAAAVYTYDGNFARLTWANMNYFRLFGCDKKQYLDIEPNEYGFRLIGREYSSLLIGKIDALAKNFPTFGLEIEAVNSTGSHLPLYAEISVETVGHTRRLSVLLHDISEKDHAMAERAEMIDMMFSVMAISADYIFRYTTENDHITFYRNVSGTFDHILSVDDFEGYFSSSGYLSRTTLSPSIKSKMSGSTTIKPALIQPPSSFLFSRKLVIDPSSCMSRMPNRPLG